MSPGLVTFVAALFILFGHVLLLPVIFVPSLFGFGTVLDTNGQLELALLVGPLTAASFVTVIKYAIDNRYSDLLKSDRTVNYLFIAAIGFAILPFYVSLYYLIIGYQNSTIADLTLVKTGVGVIEIFFGSAFALVVHALFEGTSDAAPVPVPGPPPPAPPVP